VTGDSDGVEACGAAAAQAYLDAIDNTLVEQVLCLGCYSGRLLDIGTGPGGIPLKIPRWGPPLQVVGINRSAHMIQAARRARRMFTTRTSQILGSCARRPMRCHGP
jgi:tRNA1(Val) A37 N6-methylase TrmN6